MAKARFQDQFLFTGLKRQCKKLVWYRQFYTAALARWLQIRPESLALAIKIKPSIQYKRQCKKCFTAIKYKYNRLLKYTP